MKRIPSGNFVFLCSFVLKVIPMIELVASLRLARSLKQVIARESAIQRRIHASGGTPVVESETAHFFFEHDGNADIRLIGDWNNWKPTDQLERLHPKSSLYHFAKDFPVDARLSYRFAVDGNASINDPENSRAWQEVFGNNTYFTMPAYSGTAYLDDPPANIRRGKLYEIAIPSARGLDFARKVFIYAPSGLKQGKKYYFIHVHDGEEALRIGKFANVLDNLRYHEPHLPPVIGVFIPPVNRHSEYMMNDRFAKWCANILVPEAEKFLKVKSDATMRLAQGASLGGLQAAYIGFLHPKIFGNIACQSPSFWYEDEAIIKLFARSKRRPLRFFLHTGTIHDARGEARSMLATLREKGYDVTYLETNESHNWANWSVRYETILRWLAP